MPDRRAKVVDSEGDWIVVTIREDSGRLNMIQGVRPVSFHLSDDPKVLASLREAYGLIGTFLKNAGVEV